MRCAIALTAAALLYPGVSVGQSCPGASLTACGLVQSGSTVGALDRWSQWPCDGSTTPGGEQVYLFSPSIEREVTVWLESLDGPLALRLLAPPCDPASCLGASAPASRVDLPLLAVPGETYYLVVDGPTEGRYRLGLDCPCLDQDADGSCDGDDCAPADPRRAPHLPELCDGIDNDCDGVVDNSTDEDRDGWDVCDGDCDDRRADTFPGAPERCDGFDNDCDGAPPPDELDLDGDSWRGCDGDCDDEDPLSSPSAPERCDGLDNDCDGTVPSTELDTDADGALDCEDCADADPERFPGAPELCDGVDQDCDGVAEEDADGDGLLDCDCAAAEECDNGLDDDCDGAIDRADAACGDPEPGCGCRLTGPPHPTRRWLTLLLGSLFYGLSRWTIGRSSPRVRRSSASGR